MDLLHPLPARARQADHRQAASVANNAALALPGPNTSEGERSRHRLEAEQGLVGEPLAAQVVGFAGSAAAATPSAEPAPPGRRRGARRRGTARPGPRCAPARSSRRRRGMRMPTQLTTASMRRARSSAARRRARARACSRATWCVVGTALRPAAMTRWPRQRSAWTTARPTQPLAPQTRTFTRLPSSPAGRERQRSPAPAHARSTSDCGRRRDRRRRMPAGAGRIAERPEQPAEARGGIGQAQYCHAADDRAVGTHRVDRGVEVGRLEAVTGGIEVGRRHVHQHQPAGGVAGPELVHFQRADRAGGVVEDLQRIVGGHNCLS